MTRSRRRVYGEPVPTPLAVAAERQKQSRRSRPVAGDIYPAGADAAGGDLADKPAAEVHITEALVRALLAAQHPDLADLPLTRVGGGWDNEVWRLGDSLAVRIPRRALAAPLVLNEQRWLPVIASRLAVTIPAPVRQGVPGEGFPWHWSVVPWARGRPAAELYGTGGRTVLPGLVEFVTALHVPAPAEAPSNPFRGVPLADRDQTVRERLAVERLPDPAGLLALWERALSAPVWERRPVWLHGDLHPANLLVDDDGALSAVLDFGDITAGDPAADLAVAWMVFEEAERAEFIDRVTAACGWDQATWCRARGWAVNLGTSFAAHVDDDPEFAAIAAFALRQVQT